MLSEDGTLRVFMIQVETKLPEFDSDVWRFPSLRPGAYGPLETMGSVAKCHLSEGLGGTTDVDEAYAALAEISARWPNERFRLVLVEMTRKTRVWSSSR